MADSAVEKKRYTFKIHNHVYLEVNSLHLKQKLEVVSKASYGAV